MRCCRCRLAIPPGGDRPEARPRREIVDALRHLVDTGSTWAALPQDYPPFKTVFGFFTRRPTAGVFILIRDQL
ncbi:IS5 family transposase [Streptomyces sp. SID8379]|nr:IS5 family transposase [Streptomyces sp. SID8379]